MSKISNPYINIKHRFFYFNLILLLFVNLIKPCQAQKEFITFSAQWLPQAQFAGYYMAQKKGFYTDAGLEVKILHPGNSETVVDLFESGKAEIISMMLLSALIQHETTPDLVNVAQVFQNSSLLLVARKDHGITKIEHLNGKRIGTWKSGFDELPKTMIQQNNLTVSWVPLLSGINLFLNNGIDAQVVTWYNEYNQLILSGIDEEELTTFYLRDNGYNIPEDGLYCSKSTLATRKETIVNFVQASFKGWEYASQNREETIDEVLKRMKEAHVPTNKVHQSFMLNQVLLLMQPAKNEKAGQLDRKLFEQANELLLNEGKIKAVIPYSTFFTPPLVN